MREPALIVLAALAAAGCTINAEPRQVTCAAAEAAPFAELRALLGGQERLLERIRSRLEMLDLLAAPELEDPK